VTVVVGIGSRVVDDVFGDELIEHFADGRV
jgi:hypothetical protein